MKYSIKIFLIILISFFSIYIISSQPFIELKVNFVELNLNDKYKEEFAYLKLPFSSDIKIKPDKKINTKKIGEQVITYQIKYKNKTYVKQKKIKIVEKEKPIIVLKGETSKYLCPNEEYIEEGYEASDNYDGNITNKVKIIKDNDSYTYEVKDSSLNSFSIIRKIIHEDKEKPTITLNGNDVVTYINEEYYELGYTATDNCDKDITNRIKVSGTVNTKLKGTYELTYIVYDTAGNVSEVKRTVRVIDKPINNGKVIYLTFDDGPSSNITPQILDILKEENIKATFFVINHNESLNYLIKRAHDEGHTIGIHSYSHNYRYIYTNEANYFSDLTLMENKIYSIIGIKPKIIRFPGGSSNTVSKFNSGIMTRLTKEVVTRGYSYFDWNISSGDAGETKDPNKIYKNVVSSFGNKNNIVLMHDVSANNGTLTALRNIIRYGKSQGYVFEPITEYTVPYRHKVNN